MFDLMRLCAAGPFLVLGENLTRVGLLISGDTHLKPALQYRAREYSLNVPATR